MNEKNKTMIGLFVVTLHSVPLWFVCHMEDSVLPGVVL